MRPRLQNNGSKPGVAAHSFKTSTQEAEAEQADLWVWGQPSVEFQDSLGYKEELCFEEKQKQK